MQTLTTSISIQSCAVGGGVGDGVHSVVKSRDTCLFLKEEKSSSKQILYLCTGAYLRGPLYAYLIEEWAAIIQSRLLAHQVGKYKQGGWERK